MTIIIIRVLFSHRRIRAKDVGYPLHWCTWIHTAFKLEEENEPLVGLSNGYIETNSKMINVLHLNAMFEYSFLWFTYISLPRTLIQGRIGLLNTTRRCILGIVEYYVLSISLKGNISAMLLIPKLIAINIHIFWISNLLSPALGQVSSVRCRRRRRCRPKRHRGDTN